MKKKRLVRGVLGVALLVIFVIFTASLRVVDLQPIGPNGSVVAYATVNGWVQRSIGVNWLLYHITDWAGVVAIFVAFGFAVLGLVQWIKRKSLLKVDRSILLLGVYYVLVFGVFVYFEYTVINRRPVLINGILEASYPSSTTMLATCVMPTAMLQFRRLIKNRTVGTVLSSACGVFMTFMVLGRLLCGVHWFTDVLGGAMFSTAAVLLYTALENDVK